MEPLLNELFDLHALDVLDVFLNGLFPQNDRVTYAQFDLLLNGLFDLHALDVFLIVLFPQNDRVTYALLDPLLNGLFDLHVTQIVPFLSESLIGRLLTVLFYLRVFLFSSVQQNASLPSKRQVLKEETSTKPLLFVIHVGSVES